MKTFSVALIIVAVSIVALAQSVVPLEQARVEFEKGQYAVAAQSYRAVVSAEPDNVEALAGLVDSLEAAGDWRSAIAPLKHLVSLQPNNAKRVAQLGLWTSWMGGHRDGALELLGRACSLDKVNPQPCTDYAVVLSWSDDSRGQAVAQLRDVLSRSPNYVPALRRLAEILSWNKNTHSEAIKLLDAAVELQPDDSALLTCYANALMYDRSQRPLAISLYERALRAAPDNTEAKANEAQLLAWSGQSSAAMKMYNEVLASEPDNVAALRGKAEILNWRGDYEEAYELLERAHRAAPVDARIAGELARAEMGMGHYGSAEQTIAGLPQDAEYNDVREDISRAMGTWAETGIAFRRNGNNLNYDELLTQVSTPLGFSNRATLEYSPTLYSGSADFNGNAYGLTVDSKLSDQLSLTTRASALQFPGISPEIDGGIQLRYRPSPTFEIETGFDRSPVDDSVTSLRGIETPYGFVGQVASNLADIGVRYNNRRGYDALVTYSDGVYTGRNLDSNRRWEFDGNAGKSLGGAPYFRIAYGFSYSSFGYDAEEFGAAPNHAGDYFSPTRFLLNYGGLTVSHKFNEHLRFEMTGTAGAQNVENTSASFGNAQFASTFTSQLQWRPAPKDEIRIKYDYLNVYNAFHRHLPGISWRHYF